MPPGAVIFSSNTLNTDGAGIASTILTASAPGTVLIGARVGNNPTILYETIVIEEEDGGGGGGGNSGQLILTITRTLMPADGQSTATITAEATDKLGNPVSNTTPVKFVAGEKFTDVNGDGVWTENVDQLDFDADGDGEWDAYGHINPAIDSMQSGAASATFTAGHRPGLVHIKVTVGNAEDKITGDITISLTSLNPIRSIVLTPEWQQIQVRGTGGIEWARIVAQTFDEHGNPAAEGQPLDFTITSGPGGGETIGGDAVGPVSVATDALGQAVMTLNAGTLPGTVRVRARSGSVISTATQVTIRSGPPAFISAGAEHCNVPCWELIGCENRITAVVVDEWGNEVADSTSVYFSTEQGLIEGAAETQAVLTLRGKAITYWSSALPKNDQYVYYTYETAGGTVSGTSYFLESGPPVDGSFLAAPASLPADGKSEGLVIVEVLDLHGAFVIDGTRVEMHADFGTISSGATSNGCHSSTYLTYYTSEVLDQDYSYTIPDDGIGAIATITARSGGTSGFEAVAQVILTTGAASSETSTLEVTGSMPTGSTVPVQVIIKDRYGNPLGGHLIELTAIRGTIAGSPRYTDRFGVAEGFLFTATGSPNTTATITAADLDPGYGGLVLVEFVSLTN